jgi:hypothetical protein
MFVADPAEDAIVPAEDLAMPPFAVLATPQHVAELVLYLASSRPHSRQRRSIQSMAD